MDKRIDFLTASIALGLACYTAIILVCIAPRLWLTNAQIGDAATFAGALIGVGLLTSVSANEGRSFQSMHTHCVWRMPIARAAP